MDFPDILEFWFEQVSPDDWFTTNEILDLKMVEKFIAIHSQAVAGELFRWRDEPLGRLAEIVLIDQFSRNIYRGEPKAYSADSMALVLAEEAIRNNIQKKFDTNYKQFLYMPFMHSESKHIHEIAVKLFSEPGLEKSLSYELTKKSIINKFGRFPERNNVLGRINTSEEEAYLVNHILPVEDAQKEWFLH
ncbi:MAG: DUF924 family protein [Bacteriovorax sp.]|nr:DUF924 family protein [Bacteriovorax sp.]